MPAIRERKREDAPALRIVAEEELLAAIEKAVRKAIPKLKEGFLSAIRDLVDQVDLEALGQALADGDVDAAIAAVPWDALEKRLTELAVRENGAAGPLAGPFNAGVDAALGSMPHSIAANLDDRAIRSAAADWIKDHGLEMASDLTDETRGALRDLLSDAFKEGGADAFALGRDVSEILGGAEGVSGLIGINSGQAASLSKYIDQLMATDPDEMSAEQIQAAIDGRFQEMLDYRGEMIARTEAAFAGNAGQVDVWQEAVDNEEVDSDVYVMEWVARGNACEDCAGMDGLTAEIGGEFENDGGDGPPLHPHCFCGMRLVRASEADKSACVLPFRRRPLAGEEKRAPTLRQRAAA